MPAGRRGAPAAAADAVFYLTLIALLSLGVDALLAGALTLKLRNA